MKILEIQHPGYRQQVYTNMLDQPTSYLCEKKYFLFIIPYHKHRWFTILAENVEQWNDLTPIEKNKKLLGAYIQGLAYYGSEKIQKTIGFKDREQYYKKVKTMFL